MKKTNLLLVLCILMAACWSCSKKCDCSLIYEEADVFYSKETDKPYTGVCTSLHGDGKIKDKREFIGGKPVYHKAYTKAGELYYEKLYDKAGKITLIKRWYENDDFSIAHLEYEIYKRDGYYLTEKEWYANGNIKADIVYKEGAEESGQKYSLPPSSCEVGSKLYYDNGQISHELIEPIKYFHSGFNKHDYIYQIQYTKEGYILKLLAKTGEKYWITTDLYDEVLVQPNVPIHLEDTRDLTKVLKSINITPVTIE